ncbi:alpha/beta fold hydrolase [Nocardia stercoris]|uniref:Alpha/beta hydrolase n=1 Tax=Nocardia stercoris TaxID=2483361 RepID=A0A3M2LCI3_9NOCA|nr:alpha/beta hydrolase [Nocardia stercoris]RMI35247.1 alpha/beta hydrolase [Nocardia stercoris]
MPFIETEDRTSIHFTDWGNAEGMPVVFTHAWGVHKGMWDNLLPEFLDAGFRCVAYDRRGHGRSDIAELRCDLDTLADDLSALLDALDLRDVLLVGHSLGGAEAVRYLSRQGSARVAGLVLSAPSAPMLAQSSANPAGIPLEAVDMMRQLVRTDIGAMLDSWRPEDFFGTTRAISATLVDSIRRQMVDTPVPVMLATLETNMGVDLTAELPDVVLPTLIIQGDADINNPLDLTGRRCAELIPNASLTVLPGAGHGLYLSEAEAYAEAITSFAASL